MMFIAIAVLAFIVLAYYKQGYWAWVAAAGILLLAFDPSALIVLPVVLAVIVFGIPAIRKHVVSATAMKMVAKTMPTIGETERIALEAGTVWWDGDLFSGSPNWKKLLDFKIKPLTKAEQSFLDNQTETLCKMLNDFEIAQNADLPKEVWQFIKDNKFFGIVIPKKHGGLGFSAAAHSAIVTKISSQSLTAAITVMVPNSLGPGELILHYGTDKQKKHYLPRLAKGLEIPCFALTEPTAGSDAANGQSVGIVCKGKWGGKTVTGIKVTYDKRYITLAPVATVVGLAFRLEDPNHLIGDVEDIGITCALLPSDTKGMEIGNRHDPMGTPFQNGPVRGTDVFIPMDYVIGGQKYVGQGWRMLMECLSTGRGISLPSLSVGAAELSTHVASGYSIIREQFGMPIGKFEGVRERLTRIATHAYWMNATRKLTCGAVDAGESPAVASAIAKAYLTEGMRLCINDGMDITAGSSICRGPRNIFARPYAAIPVGITVEGANILTRSLIVFGQGAIRCHPFVQAEVEALATNDLIKFDKAFFGHVNHMVCNIVKAEWLAWTGGIFSPSPVSNQYAKYYKRLNKLSSAFAVMADVGLGTLGGALKRKEHLSGHYADSLAWMYIASATLKQLHDNKYSQQDAALAEHSLTTAMYHIEQGISEVLRNLPNRFIAGFMKLSLQPFGTWHKLPNEKQIEAVADALMDIKTGVRASLTPNVFVPNNNEDGLGKLETTLNKVLAAQPVRAKITKALRKGVITKSNVANMATASHAAKVISKTELTLILKAETARLDAIQVDDFTPAQYKKLK